MRYTSRKFILALLAMATATVLMYLDAIESAAWASVMLGTVGAYITGNVAQKRVLDPTTTTTVSP